MADIRVTASFGFTKSSTGQVTCDVNVDKPIAPLTGQEVGEQVIDGFGKGFIAGAFPMIGPGFVTGPLGGWVGYGLAQAENERRAEMSEVRERHWGDAKKELTKAGCDASNTRYADFTRTE